MIHLTSTKEVEEFIKTLMEMSFDIYIDFKLLEYLLKFFLDPLEKISKIKNLKPKFKKKTKLKFGLIFDINIFM